MDGNFRRVLISLDQLHLLRSISYRKQAEGFPLYNGQLPILEFIQHKPGCTQAEVSAQLLISPASVAQSTKRLERGGLLERRVDADNRRCNRLHLTEAGRGLIGECRARFDQVDCRLFQGFSPGELETLRAYLYRLLENAAQDQGMDLARMDRFSFFALINKLNDKEKHEKEWKNV